MCRVDVTGGKVGSEDIMLKYYEYFPTVMKCLLDGRCYKSREIMEYCCEKLNISEEDKKQVISSGQTVVYNRINWAITYLRKAKLIESPKRGTSQITERGKEAVKIGVENITLEYLHRFKEFNDFCCANKIKETSDKSANIMSDESPQEQIEKSILQINSDLADEIMTEITGINPYEFERLVVQLLIKMGYGSLNLNETAVTKKSGDEGIDGIISADRFGFDTVYVQAKQWKKETSVGRPEIQKFLGALAGQGATKGLFITTAHFSKEAKEFANKNLQSKIVLIDGEELCNLMIEFDLGVSTVEIYKIKKIDSDYFNNEF